MPLLHDTPTELAQPFGGDGHDWKKGECEPMPGRNLPTLHLVERDYPNVYRKFTARSAAGQAGQRRQGHRLEHREGSEAGRRPQPSRRRERRQPGRPRIDSAIDAAEVVLALAPETNGQVAVKAWEALSKITGREHAHLALPKEDEKIRFRDIQVQPRKIISSPTWSGLEDEHVSYNAGYTNVHELIPWRTITGRQQFYQDHPWMQGSAKASSATGRRSTPDHREAVEQEAQNPEITLNWITPTEMGHPLHLQRQPADAHPVARRSDHLGRARRGQGRDRR